MKVGTHANVTYMQASRDVQRDKQTQTTYLSLRVNPAMGRSDVSVLLYSTLILHPTLSSLFLSFTLRQPLSTQTVPPISPFLPKSDFFL